MTKRRDFLFGVGTGAIGLHFGNGLWDGLFREEGQPPWAVEHATGSYWLDNAGYFSDPAQPPLNDRVYRTGTLVIGGGYTGMSTAWHLMRKQPNTRITLIDAAQCGFGASGRNGGFCMALNYNSPEFNPELTAPSQQFMSSGIDIIRNLGEVHGVDCDFTPANYVAVVRTHKGLESIQKKIEMAGMSILGK